MLKLKYLSGIGDWMSSKVKITNEKYFIDSCWLVEENLIISIIQTFSRDSNDTLAFKILSSPLSSELYHFTVESKYEISKSPSSVTITWLFQDNKPDPWNHTGPSVWKYWITLKEYILIAHSCIF